MSVITHQRPVRLLSLSFIGAYAVTMRPYLLFVSGVTGIAGLSLAPHIAVETALLLGTVFFLSYGFGQALTDCFQLDTDSLSAPYRPLVRGTVRRDQVMAVSLVGLITSGLVVASYNSVNIPLALVTVVGLTTYTYFKRRWWAGPFYNAAIVAILLLIGYAAGAGAAAGAVEVSMALIGAILVAFFGYANFVLTGYYKDISADRATGYNTLPVVAGLHTSTAVSDGFAAFTLVGCAVAVAEAAGNLAVIVFVAAGVMTTIIGQVRLRRVSEATAHRAIAPVVHSYILLMSAVAVANKPMWAAALALFYLGFLVTMRSRPMRQQI